MPQTIGIECGPTIRRLRKKAGLTQEQLADQAGFNDKSSISKIERGETTVTVERLDAIANALGVKPAALVLGVLRERYPEMMQGHLGAQISQFASLVE